MEVGLGASQPSFSEGVCSFVSIPDDVLREMERDELPEYASSCRDHYEWASIQQVHNMVKVCTCMFWSIFKCTFIRWDRVHVTCFLVYIHLVSKKLCQYIFLTYVVYNILRTKLPCPWSSFCRSWTWSCTCATFITIYLYFCTSNWKWINVT